MSRVRGWLGYSETGRLRAENRVLARRLAEKDRHIGRMLTETQRLAERLGQKQACQAAERLRSDKRFCRPLTLTPDSCPAMKEATWPKKIFPSTAPWWAAWPAGWPKWPSRKSPGTTSPTGILELVGAAAGLWRLDRRLARSLTDTLARAQDGQGRDYQEVKRRIDELTRDLPELREILGNMVDAGISAQQA